MTLEEKMAKAYRAYKPFDPLRFKMRLVNLNRRLVLPQILQEQAVQGLPAFFYVRVPSTFWFKTENEAVAAGDELLQRHMAQAVNITYREKGVEMTLTRRVRKRGVLTEWKLL